MRWSSITTLLTLAATALGAPTPSTAAELTIADELRFQGDGFYMATFDDAGVANVTFTPLAELTVKVPAPITQNQVTGNVDTVLAGPTDTTCVDLRSDSVIDMDAANVALADAAPNGYNQKAWGWIHRNKQTSFWCNYERNYLTHDLVLSMHTDISSRCGGSSSYGYTQRRIQGGVRNLVVGRTFTGDHFCTSTFKGRRDSTPSPTPPIPVAAPWTIAPEVSDQGEGLYEATFDKAGQATVKFTPRTALAQAPVTKNPVPRDINTLFKRDTTCSGKSTSDTGSLDAANEQVAHGVDGKKYTGNEWIWYNSAIDTSFYCSYTRNTGSYQEVIDMHILISSRCGGGAAYGYDHRKTPQGTYDHSVGRTFRGDTICWPGNHSRREARAPTSLSIPSNLREQGDGFYVATFNEAGKASVKFTPMAELTPTAEIIANVAVTKDLVAKSSIDILLKRSSQTCSHHNGEVSKLDEANVQLGHNADGQHYNPNSLLWVHNGGETAYMCAYNGQAGSYNKVISSNSAVSNSCGGSAAYGFSESGSLHGVDHLVIGRTFAGDHFCTSTYKG